MKKISLTVLLCFFASVSVFSEENTDLISNGSFEENLSQWEVPSFIKETIAPQIDKSVIQGPGSASLRFNGKLNSRAFILQTVKLDKLKASRKFKISGWVKIENFENSWTASITVECIIKEEGKVSYKYFGINTPWQLNKIDWTRYEKIFEIPDNTEYLRVILQTRSPSGTFEKGNSGTVWFDNISLETITQQI